ncbi:ser-thr protein kinase [Tripterygium wilfordii]|uniref:Ser-thr protein kinase n=1 Tax=Tripterygium wilfordii TaxID=458696 RepID=A0A7J7DDM7_TRIWF|nr:ser-thr protein kinase [Tripterygium wilfordii]
MGGGWKKNWHKPHMTVVLVVSSLLYWNLSFCWAMNSEGVPKLKRSELEAACEDFSNIISTFSDGSVYKGTGVEIAVTSCAVTSRDEWSKNSEAHFRKKIEILSSVNHKNFVNLIGFCEEDEPFTRMMVFEYAPNGTLFEHLHIKESEHLDWGMRIRIAMGMTLQPKYQTSVSGMTGSAAAVETPSTDPESNAYSFGIILLEIITGKIPYSVDNDSQVEWISDCVRGERPLKEMVDPTLKSFQEEELEKLLEVIKSCIHPDAKQRPTMKDVAAELQKITAVGPDGATPKLSPLWWAELEILSTEGS